MSTALMHRPPELSDEDRFWLLHRMGHFEGKEGQFAIFVDGLPVAYAPNVIAANASFPADSPYAGKPRTTHYIVSTKPEDVHRMIASRLDGILDALENRL